MKTIKLIAVICCSLFLITKNVSALENDTNIIKTYVDNIYYTQVTNGNIRWSQYATFSTNNKPVFCIGPGISVISSIYNSSNDWEVVNLSIDKIKQIELIGNYGYNYLNHQTLNYYLATQKMLWETLGVDEAFFSDAGYGGGNVINLNAEISNINNLISKHYIKPSFDGILLRGFIGDRFTLIDRNSEIHNFNIISENNHDITLENDVLDVVLSNYDDRQILLEKGEKNSTIYTSEASQPMADFGSTMIKVNSEISIEVLEGIVNINFSSLSNFDLVNSIYKIEKLKYSEDMYGEELMIVDSNFEPIVFSIDFENKARVNDLTRGSYRITQITPRVGFIKDEANYDFIVDEDHIEQDITLEAFPIMNQLIINKFINDNESGICIKESGIKFEIYSNDLNYGLLITNENGSARTILKYGEYIIKQINTTEGYEMVDDFSVIIDNNTDDKTYNLVSNKIIEEVPIIDHEVIVEEEIVSENKINEEEISLDDDLSNSDDNIFAEIFSDNEHEIIEFVMPKTTMADIKPLIGILIVLLLGIILIIRELKNEK